MARKRGRGANNTGSIYYRETDKRWIGVLSVGKDANGKYKRKYVYGKTEKEAVDKLDELKLKYKTVDPHKEDVTVEELCLLWVNQYQTKVKQNTKNSYYSNIYNHISPIIGGLQISKVTTGDIQYALDLTYKDGGSNSLFTKVFNILNGSFEWAKKKSMVKANPCVAVAFPRNTKKKVRALNTDEQKQFIHALSGEWYRPLFLFYLYSGCRLGEALPLRWVDLDLDERTASITKTVIVEREVHLIDGKPKGKSIERVQYEPKTESSNRKVYLTPGIVDVLKEHKAYLKELARKMKKPWSEEALVFPNSRGKIPHMSNVSAVFRRIRDAAGIEDFTIHGLRHTYASVAFKENMSIKAISKQLGHCSVKTTYDIYIDFIDDQYKMETDKIAVMDENLVIAD